MGILDRLGSGEGVPIEAIRAATADRAAVTPVLLEAIERCTPKDEIEENGLFIAFHLLGQWREKAAYRPLARFLRRPEAYRILGDAVSETSHRVMASVFDGDPGPIYDIINDPEANEFVRRGMFGALVILVLHSELDRSEVVRFLQSSFSDLQPQGPSAVWNGWQGAVAALGLTELTPSVREAFERDFVDQVYLDFEDADGQMQDYDPLVEPDPDEWLAAGEQERIDAVKYYHRDAESEAERSTLHAVIHAVVENQIAEGDELPARRTMTRLMDQGLDRHQAIHAVGSVLAGHINELAREAKAGRDPGGDVNVPYFAELERLTAKDWLNSG